jgi:pimeloyl-ACP methyl ester carboxylesterase
LRDFVLIGHSMGGMMSLNYASTHPGRLGALIIVDTVMLMPLERVKSMNEFGGRPAKPYETQEELISRYRLEASNKNLTRREVLRRMAELSGKQGPDGKWRHKADRSVYASFKRIDGVPLWKNVKVPALAIRAEGSSRFNGQALAEIHANAPQVQVAEVPASDHHITLDNPQGFVKVVRDFLRG